MNKIQGCLILLLSLLPTSQAGNTVPFESIDFVNNYGLDKTNCPADSPSGWYIDQAYDSPKCFPRQVECTRTEENGVVEMSATGNTRECPTGYTFIPDTETANNDNDACYSVSSSEALGACGVTVDCTLDG